MSVTFGVAPALSSLYTRVHFCGMIIIAENTRVSLRNDGANDARPSAAE